MYENMTRFPEAYKRGFDARVAFAKRISAGEVEDHPDFMPPEPYTEPKWPDTCYPNECHAYRCGWARAIDLEI